MRRLMVVALLTLAAPGAVAQERAGFVVRLGTDTLAVEEYTRTATRVSGVSVTRTPRPSHRAYTLDLHADGTPRRLEIVAERLDAGPGPARTTTTVEFGADSARSTVPRGDSSATVAVASGPGAAPFVFGVMGFIEQLAVQARAAGRFPYTVPFVGPGSAPASQATITAGGGDTLRLMIRTPVGAVGPWIVRADARGRLVEYDGRGTPFQARASRLASADVAGARAAFGARPLGPLSARDTMRATVDGAEVAVEYSRPARRGRDVFGAVVPWGEVWRTGANQATHLKTSADLEIGGATVPAGTYTLWTIPTPRGWTLIVNRQTGQWGTVYSPEQDLVRVPMTVDAPPATVERFTIAIEPEGAGSQLRLSWDGTRASVPIARKR